jgi:hypothetical protein
MPKSAILVKYPHFLIDQLLQPKYASLENRFTNDRLILLVPETVNKLKNLNSQEVPMFRSDFFLINTFG